MQKIVSCLLIVLYFSIPLIHGQILKNFWGDMWLSVSGNFEFTKSQFFIFLSGCTLCVFSIQQFVLKRSIVFPNLLFFLLWALWFSLIFSLTPYTSFFWSSSKWHGNLMFLCLIWIYIILIQQDKNLMKKLFISSVCWAFFASLIAIKEYYSPTFSYGDLSNRALGTFGHPNYLSGYILLLIPFLFKKVQQNTLLYIAIIPMIISLFLTKSVWAMSIFLVYCIYIFWFRKKSDLNNSKEKFIVLLLFFIFVAIFVIIQFWLTTKLHSFISRFYIWETTLKIIIENPKILLFWSWAESLFVNFENFKSPELYIFENFWFSADRPHNMFLNILFHFWLWWAFIFLWALFFLYKKYRDNYLYHALILILFFSMLNFLSISSYLIIVLILSCITIQERRKFSFIFPVILLILGLWSAYTSSHFYTSELLAYKKQYDRAIDIFPYNYKNYEYLWDWKNTVKYAGYFTKNFYINQLHISNTESVCDSFIRWHSSAEVAFFCGNYAWALGKKDLAKKYYSLWLEKIPDLWNHDSPYNSSIFISKFIDGKRFFSEKYSNIDEILIRLWYEEYSKNNNEKIYNLWYGWYSSQK